MIKLELDSHKKAYFLAGYLSHKILDKSDEQTKMYYVEKLVTPYPKINREHLMRIYVWINKIYSEKDMSGFDDLIEYTSLELLKIDSVETDINVGYYYMLGFTSKDIKIDGSDIFY